MQSFYYFVIVFAAVFLSFASSAHDNNLEEEYTFHRELDPSGHYVLYWRFNLSTETIHFAVDVETEGWVGFGISHTGRMPGSDVVMGWIDDRTGESHFNVCYYTQHAVSCSLNLPYALSVGSVCSYKRSPFN